MGVSLFTSIENGQYVKKNCVRGLEYNLILKIMLNFDICAIFPSFFIVCICTLLYNDLILVVTKNIYGWCSTNYPSNRPKLHFLDKIFSSIY